MIREGAPNVNFRAAAAPGGSWVLAIGVPPRLSFFGSRGPISHRRANMGSGLAMTESVDCVTGYISPLLPFPDP